MSFEVESYLQKIGMIGGKKKLPANLIANARMAVAKTGMREVRMARSESMDSQLKGEVLGAGLYVMNEVDFKMSIWRKNLDP